jgi:hypothetical protein
MTLALRALVVCLCLGRLALASSADESADLRKHCPGAVQWRDAHRDQLPSVLAERDRARSLSRPGLRAQLEARVERDQRARRAWLANQSNRALEDAVRAADADNLSWLRPLVDPKNFPTAREVGEYGVHLTWVLLQHAGGDRQLQVQALPLLQRSYRQGELPAADLARFTDRLRLAARQSQWYGTQFPWLSGRFVVPRGRRLEALDEHRRELGLMPLADYACMMNEALQHHFEGDPD